MDIIERVMAIRTGGSTERCHGIRHQGSYNVAAHTWGALTLLYVLWPEDFARLAPCVTFHDIPEAWVGDIPAPTKRYSSQVKEACDVLDSAILKWLNLPDCEHLSVDDRRKVRACDHLELYLWAQEEVASGNSHASCVVRQLERFFEETPLPERARDLFLQAGVSNVVHSTDGLIKEICGNQK